MKTLPPTTLASRVPNAFYLNGDTTCTSWLLQIYHPMFFRQEPRWGPFNDPSSATRSNDKMTNALQAWNSFLTLLGHPMFFRQEPLFSLADVPFMAMHCNVSSRSHCLDISSWSLFTFRNLSITTAPCDDTHLRDNDKLVHVKVNVKVK